MVRSLELTATTWEPLAGGLLSGRYGSDREHPTGTRIADDTNYSRRLEDERQMAIVDALNAVADARGVSSARITLAWILHQRHRAGIVPIVGARRPEQLEDSLAAVDTQLTSDELDALDKASAIDLGFPTTFPGRMLAYGDQFANIDGARDWTEELPRP